jgi:carbon starvation protein
MLAAIALCVCTGIIIKSGKLKYVWVTALPLLWLTILTSTAVYEKVSSDNPRLGFFAAADDLSQKLASGVLPPEKAAVAPQLIFNQQLDAWLALLFAALLWIIILDMLRMASRHLRGLPVPASNETPYQRTLLEDNQAENNKPENHGLGATN